MTMLAWLLVLSLYSGSQSGPIQVSTAYFATESACGAAADGLRGPYLMAKCFPTGAARMSRVTEEDGR